MYASRQDWLSINSFKIKKINEKIYPRRQDCLTVSVKVKKNIYKKIYLSRQDWLRYAWGPHKCQKRPNVEAKKDLVCTSIQAKETYYPSKRDLVSLAYLGGFHFKEAKETYYRDTRDLLYQQKRPSIIGLPEPSTRLFAHKCQKRPT